MKLKAILKLLASLLLMLSLFMFAAAGVSLYFQESLRIFMSFLVPALSCVLFFATTFFFARGRERAFFSAKSGYLFVSLAWVAASCVGAIPYLVSGAVPSFTKAFFETMSGFTTTGASIFADVEVVPRSILLWRSTTHWLGGMGIVVLTVAILPLLGLGGLQLVEAESPGPTVGKVTPRMAGTAKILWLIYILLTVAEILLLRLGGMGWFDAVCYAFGTVATGGFSTKNLSVGHYSSPFIDIVVTTFMVLAGMNFTLFYKVGKGRIREVFKDSEFLAYVSVFFGASLLIAFDLMRGGLLKGFGTAFRYGAFQSASILTTTGFATTDFDLWPPFSKVVLIMLMFIGGCSGSTAGGIKVVRYLVLLKQSMVQLKYYIIPRGVFTVRVNGEPVRKMIVFESATFFFLYILTALVCTLVTASAGYGIETSLTATLATLGNIGPGMALVGPVRNYGFFPDYVTWTQSFAMLVGRLELYTVFVLFSSAYRRH